MAESYLVEVILRANDQASAKIRDLQRAVDELKASAAGKNATQDLERGFDDLGDSAKDSADEVERHNQEAEKLRRSGPQTQSALRDNARAHDQVAESAGRHADSVGKAADSHDDLIDSARRGESVFRSEGSALDDLGSKFTAARQKGEDLSKSFDDFNGSVKRGQLSIADATRGYQAFQGEFSKLSRSFDIGSDSAVRFGRMADDVTSRLKRMPEEAGGWAERLTQGLPTAGGALENFASRVSAVTDGIGLKVVSLSAHLRGLSVLGIVGFLQQLDTGLLGLAGGLVSVASDAAEAAGAVGGMLVAAMTQAIPVAAVLLAGLERIKSVLDAVKLSQQIQQQQAFDPTQAASTALQTSEALMSAQNGLVNAYDNVVTAQQRVTESQEELTQARIDAIRNLQDLAIAEKTATEQAAGARLSLVQAQQQLQELQATGGTGLQLQQAQLAVQEAGTGVQQANLQVPRSRQDYAIARREGVGGNLELMAAQEAARQAPIDLANAREAVKEAQDQLKLAQMTAASPSGHETSDQGELQYMLAHMSAPEKTLYTALDKLETQLKQPNSPLAKIADAFVEPFAKAIDGVDALFQNPKFVQPMERLADSMAKGFDKLFSGHSQFWITMANDAAANGPLIESYLHDIFSLIGSIAKAAAPALHTGLEQLSGFLGQEAKKEGSEAGQDRLTGEFDKWEKDLVNILKLLDAFHGLLKAVAADAAPSGNSLIVSLTKSLDNATDWVKGHGQEVRKFFTDTMQVMGVMGGLLLSWAKTMAAIFNPSSMRTFSQFLENFVLPAITDISKAIGTLMQLVMKLFDALPGGRELLEGIVAAFVSLLVINKVADAFTTTTRYARALFAAMRSFATDGSIKNAFQTFTNHLNNVRDSAKGAAGEVENLGNKQQEAGDKANIASGKEKSLAAEQADAGATAKTATPEEQALAAQDEAVATEGAAAATAETNLAAGEVAAGSDASVAGAGAVAAGTVAKGAGAGAGAAGAAADSAAAARVAAANVETAGVSSAESGGTLTSGMDIAEATGGGLLLPAGIALFMKQMGILPGANTGDTKFIKSHPTGSINLPSLAGSESMVNTENSQQAWDKYLSSLDTVQSHLKSMSPDKFQQFIDYAQKLANDPNMREWRSAILNEIQILQSDFPKSASTGAASVAQTFTTMHRGMNQTMLQAHTDMQNNMSQLSTAMSIGAQPGATGLARTITSAYELVLTNTQRTVQGTSEGMGKIGGLVQHALKAFGVKGDKTADLSDLNDDKSFSLPSLSMVPSFAAGGWVPAQSGGAYRAGEGGHDEVVLSTDPAHADRSRELLSQYIGRTRGYAAGGMVDPKLGIPGDIGLVGQDAIDKVFGVAQSYLSGRTGSGTAGVKGSSGFTPTGRYGGAPWTGPWVQRMYALAKQYNWNVEDWINVINHESGGSSTARNPTSGAYGLGQLNPASGTLQEYAKYGSESPNPVEQIYAMAMYIKNSYGNPAAAWAHELAYNWYAAGGLLARHLRRHVLRKTRKLFGFADGGRAPWGGEPVPIVAHEGERIANPSQWGEVARLAGTTPSGLDHHLGYDGTPRQHFDAGGRIVSPNDPGAAATSSPAGMKALSDFFAALKILPAFSGANPADSVTTINKAFTALQKAFKYLNSSAVKMQPLTDQINAVVQVLAAADTNFQNWLGQFQQMQTRLTDQGEMAGYRFGAQNQVVSEGVGAGDPRTVETYEKQTAGLKGEQGYLRSTLAQIVQKRRQSKLITNAAQRTAALVALNTAYENTQNELTSVGDAMATNLQSTYQAEQQSVQDELTRISDKYGTQQAKLQARQSAAQSYGRYNALPSVDLALAQSSQANVGALQTALKSAQQMGDQATVAQIKQQIAQLNESIAQYTAQALQDKVTAITNQFQTQQAGVQAQQSEAQTFGQYNVLPAIDTAFATSMQNQVTALQKTLAQAQSSGNVGEAQQIKQQIDQLNSSIVQYTAQALADAISYVQQQAQTDTSRTSMLSSLASTATNAGNFQLAGVLSSQSYQSAISSDTRQVGAYAGAGANLGAISSGNYSSVSTGSLLGQAISTNNQGAIATIVQALDGLDSDLAQNTQALTDNTSATNNAAAAYVQARGQFQSGVYGGLAQTVQTIGQITGYTDVPTLQGLYQGSNNSLQGTNNQLAGTLNSDFGVNLQGQSPQQMISTLMGLNMPGMESGMDQSQVTEFENLVNSIVTNTQAIVQNNLALAQLNGQLSQPQSFSSSIWQNFRDAIFTGMGGLQPSYAGSLGIAAATNPAFTGTGIGGSSVATTIVVNSNPLLPPVSPYTAGKQLAFAIKTPR